MQKIIYSLHRFFNCSDFTSLFCTYSTPNAFYTELFKRIFEIFYSYISKYFTYTSHIKPFYHYEKESFYHQYIIIASL